MRQYASMALIGGAATLLGVSAANAGCGCGLYYGYYGYYGAAYAAPVVVVAPPVVVAAPQPVYVVNQGQFPYLHGYDFYNRTYYSGGPYGSPVGYPGYYHPYADIGYSGLPGVGTPITRVGPEYVRARHIPTWRLERPYHPWHAPYHAPLRPEDK